MKIVLASILALILASYFFRHSVAVNLSYEVDANYLDFISLHADIQQYPKYTMGRADQGVVLSDEVVKGHHGEKFRTIEYVLHSGKIQNRGKRVYAYDPEAERVTIDVASFTSIIREDNQVRWIIEGNDDKTAIEIDGVRHVPWIFLLFMPHDEQNVLNLIVSIERALKNAQQGRAP